MLVLGRKCNVYRILAISELLHELIKFRLTEILSGGNISKYNKPSEDVTAGKDLQFKINIVQCSLTETSWIEINL